MPLALHRYKLSLGIVIGLSTIVPKHGVCRVNHSSYPLLKGSTSPVINYTYYRGEYANDAPSYASLLTNLSFNVSSFDKLESMPRQPKSGVHPRKKLLDAAPLHTERSWLYSAIIPGLGQFYNGDYWRLLIVYGVFAGLGWGAIYNHDEYTTAKREFVEKHKKLKIGKKDEDLSGSNLGNFMAGRKRDRTIFMVAMGVWHIINIFDAYVMGTLKTFDVSDDLEVVVKPTEPSLQQSGIGLSFGLQPKTELISQ